MSHKFTSHEWTAIYLQSQLCQSFIKIGNRHFRIYSVYFQYTSMDYLCYFFHFVLILFYGFYLFISILLSIVTSLGLPCIILLIMHFLSQVHFMLLFFFVCFSVGWFYYIVTKCLLFCIENLFWITCRHQKGAKTFVNYK